jgi:hypothetical protein
VKIEVDLRDTLTGHKKTYVEESSDDNVDHETVVFMWSEGNYSCDCNRSLFLWDWDRDKDLPCSQPDGRIVVDSLRVDGVERYREP